MKSVQRTAFYFVFGMPCGTSRTTGEQHYYPHGLTIAGGGQNTTPLVNKYLYQTKNLQSELGMELYDFHARQYDPQIGRFWGVDPADQYPSGYTGMGNDPAGMIDPTGMVAVGAGTSSGSSDEDRGLVYDDSYMSGVKLAWDFEKGYVGGWEMGSDDQREEVSEALDNTSVQSNWQWFPLTKPELENIVSAMTGLTGGALQNRTGEVFQNTFDDFMHFIGDVGYRGNNNQFPTDVEGRSGVIPDGISAAKIVTNRGIAIVPDASWYEVKAGRGAITKSSFNNQAWGMVSSLANSNPASAAKGWASLTFATTHNMSVSPTLVRDAKNIYNINVSQYKAMYRFNNGNYQVTFYNPSMVNSHIIRYLSPIRPSVNLNFK